MKLKDLIAPLEIVSMTADPETEIRGLSYDSRRTEEGDLFVAIRGFETDGHRFIPRAIEKRAAVILCEVAPEQDIPYVQVKDSRHALALCSCAFYGNPSAKMRVIGITGTSGKTSVSTLLKHVLEETRGPKVGMIGTTGIQIGQEEIPSEYTTPESLELQKLFAHMAKENCSHAVMEVSSHALALSRVAGIKFDTALFTNLSQDHLDFHGTMEDYALAKKKIFSQCRSAWVNADDSWTPFMTEGVICPVRRFGTAEEAALRAENVRFYPDRVVFDAVYEGGRTETVLHIPGTFSVANALAVMAAALSEGISPEESARALATAHGVKGRLESVPTDGNYHILIDYSHKPDALEKVLRSLRPTTAGRLICLFGCGGDRDRLKRPLMGKIAAELSDLVILTSDNPRTEEPERIIDEIQAGLEGTSTPWIRICDRVEAIHRAIDLAQDGDVILLAGKGHEDYQIVGHEKRHMDERELVAGYLRERETKAL
ncbi:MAG: UDP-N-acetylmuramoyl-L-alanyl-D-glutamate--2,6-diaminopimelate ligase [Oscillospiraceae bacterium]|nr:UDP-N-acetylmuramoyl-L-alanyl-D-glutamate--2,6-diaminopimelate ligase [Oscillospiraceae bacterium]